MKKNISKLQIFRTTIQVIFLFLIPEIFTLAFSEVGKIYTMIAKGSFNIYSAASSSLVLIIVLLITIIWGRFFCGWFCAFGTFSDLIHMVSKSIFKIKFKVDEKLDEVLKYLKYLVLAFIAIFIWTMGSNLFKSSSPWDAFAQITQMPQAISDYTIGFILLAVIIVGTMFIERFFCRYLCPMGAILNIFSKFRILKVSKKDNACGNCSNCTKGCAMGISLRGEGKITSGECINCFKCTDACYRKNTVVSILGENFNAAIISSLVIVLFLGLYGFTNVIDSLISSSNPVSAQTASVTTNAQANYASNSSTAVSTKGTLYKDGTYTGTAVGYRPGLKVKVTVKDGKIATVDVISINDTPRFYQRVLGIIPNEIITSQSTNVDSVSGATRTSNGIKNAVDNALSNAK